MTSDYTGMAVLLTSAGAFIVSMVNLWRGRERDLRLDSIDKHVNSLSDKRETMGVRVGTAEGHAAGLIEGEEKEKARSDQA